MKCVISDPISLPTKYGEFEAKYVSVMGPKNELVREGAILSILKDDNSDPLVRVQSSCLFSESFWASDCDCSLQLEEAMRQIAEHGGSIVYFYEEGRGYGLAKKFEAIRLQQVMNYDTKQAFDCLNIEPDGRSYEAAGAVIKLVYPDRGIIILTNNPAKRVGLERTGVKILSQKLLVCGKENPAIAKYLKEKVEVLGHKIEQ